MKYDAVYANSGGKFGREDRASIRSLSICNYRSGVRRVGSSMGSLWTRQTILETLRILMKSDYRGGARRIRRWFCWSMSKLWPSKYMTCWWRLWSRVVSGYSADGLVGGLNESKIVRGGSGGGSRWTEDFRIGFYCWFTVAGWCGTVGTGLYTTRWRNFMYWIIWIQSVQYRVGKIRLLSWLLTVLIQGILLRLVVSKVA